MVFVINCMIKLQTKQTGIVYILAYKKQAPQETAF
jgi:hypothetical protein